MHNLTYDLMGSSSPRPPYSLFYQCKIVGHANDFEGIKCLLATSAIISKTHAVAMSKLQGLRPVNPCDWERAVQSTMSETNNCVVIFKERRFDANMTTAVQSFMIDKVYRTGEFS